MEQRVERRLCRVRRDLLRTFQKLIQLDPAAQSLVAEGQQRCAVLCGIDEIRVAGREDVVADVGAWIVVEYRVIPAQKSVQSGKGGDDPDKVGFRERAAQKGVREFGTAADIPEKPLAPHCRLVVEQLIVLRQHTVDVRREIVHLFAEFADEFRVVDRRLAVESGCDGKDMRKDPAVFFHISRFIRGKTHLVQLSGRAEIVVKRADVVVDFRGGMEEVPAAVRFVDVGNADPIGIIGRDVLSGKYRLSRTDRCNAAWRYSRSGTRRKCPL